MGDFDPNASRASLLDLLLRTSRALAGERDRPKVVEHILLEAQALVGADGGTLYLMDQDTHLRFAILRNDTLKIHEGGTSSISCHLTPVPLFHPDGRENHDHLAARCYWRREAITIDNVASAPPHIDTSNIRAFDAQHDYVTHSFWSIPLYDAAGHPWVSSNWSMREIPYPVPPSRSIPHIER